MNPGAMEEGVKVAGGVVESLKAQPLSLALVIMNVALLCLLFYVARSAMETRRHETEAFYQAQKETQAVLSKCIEPEQILELLKSKGGN